jgi:pimeloyl-ACP methyl ester carboxylesterase
MAFAMKDLVVVVPGIGGSALKQRGKPVWGDSGEAIGRALLTLGQSVKNLELPPDIGTGEPDDGVIPTKLLTGFHLIPGLWGIDGYSGLREYLFDKFDLTRATAEQAGNYLEFPYDWRLSNVVSARRLKSAVEPALQRLRETYQNLTEDAEPRIVFVCHSMGGLIARYYIEVLGGCEKTRRLITIGTPFRGSINALDYLANGYRPGWGPVRINLSRLMASFPSVYELLPTYECIVTGEGMKNLADVNVPNIPKARIGEAVAFHESIRLGVASRKELGYDVTPIKGQMQPTALAARINTKGVETLDAYEQDDRIRGDGTVPRFSSHPPEWGTEEAGRTIYTAGRHTALQDSSDVLTQLHGLLSAGSIRKPMGGIPIGVSLANTIDVGDTLSVTAVSDETVLQLQALVKNLATGDTSTRNLTNEGEGHYRTDFTDLAPGVHQVTVGSATLQWPVDAVRDTVLVWNPKEEL